MYDVIQNEPLNDNNIDIAKYAIGFFNQDGISNILCFEVPYTKADFEKEYERIRKRSKTAGQLLKEIQEDYNISINDIAARTGLSQAAIDRLRNDRNERREFITMIKLCAGLDLEPKVANELLRLSGVALNDSTRTNMAYGMIINNMQGLPAVVKEKFLKDNDIAQLGINDIG